MGNSIAGMAKIGLIVLTFGGLWKVLNDITEDDARRSKELSQAQLGATCSAIGRADATMRGTNSYIPVQSGQDFLNYLGINYQLKTNEVVGLEPSMGTKRDWDSIYVIARDKDANGGGIIPGFATRSQLEKYSNSHRKLK